MVIVRFKEIGTFLRSLHSIALWSQNYREFHHRVVQ